MAPAVRKPAPDNIFGLLGNSALPARSRFRCVRQSGQNERGSVLGRLPMVGDSAHRPVAGTRRGIHRPGLLVRGGWRRCRRRGMLLGIRRRFGDGRRIVRWEGLRRHRSPNHRRLGNRLPAYRRCGKSDRLLHSLRLLDRDSLWRGVGLRGGGRLRGRDRLGHQVRGMLIDGISLRHEWICWRGGEHPGDDPRQHQDSRTTRHQSHHCATETEHYSPQALPTGVRLPLAIQDHVLLAHTVKIRRVSYNVTNRRP